MADTPKNPVGRPKGSVNKLTEELRSLLEAEAGEHPAVILKRIANDAATETNVRVQAASALMPYMAPKLRQVELSSSDPDQVVTGVVFSAKFPERPKAEGDA